MCFGPADGNKKPGNINCVNYYVTEVWVLSKERARLELLMWILAFVTVCLFLK
jgi:hypothetical protein